MAANNAISMTLRIKLNATLPCRQHPGFGAGDPSNAPRSRQRMGCRGNLKTSALGRIAFAGSLTSSTAALPSIGAPLRFFCRLMCLPADR